MVNSNLNLPTDEQVQVAFLDLWNTISSYGYAEFIADRNVTQNTVENLLAFALLIRLFDRQATAGKLAALETWKLAEAMLPLPQPVIRAVGPQGGN